jgi:prevent-host-death family protein
MKVSSTEVQNNFGKYIKIAAEIEDVIITKKGKQIARLTSDSERYIVAEEAVNYLVNGNRKMSYDEFIDFTENSEARYELIDGDVILMSSPSYSHQSIIVELLGILIQFFKGKKCKPLTSPFDITLQKSKTNICVVQPDIVVICDTDKVNEKGNYMGVPSLAVEVLSPSTRRKDMIRKLDLFLQTGVKEYWVVDPEKKEFYVYIFKKIKNEYEIFDYCTYTLDMTLKSKSFEGLEVVLKDVFTE